MDIPYSREEIKGRHRRADRSAMASKGCYVPARWCSAAAGPMGLLTRSTRRSRFAIRGVGVGQLPSATKGKLNRRPRPRVQLAPDRPPGSVIHPAAPRRPASTSTPFLAKVGGPRRAGYEEGILLDSRGMVCGGQPARNLFIVKDGKIATPHFSSDILGGINRASVITIMARPLGFTVEGARRRRPR